MGDDKRCGKVVVHGVVALLAQLAYHLLGVGVALGRGCDAVEVGNAVHQLLQSLLRSLQCLVREVDCSTIVGRQYEEAYGHWRVGLLEVLVVASEELLKGDKVAQRLAHLLSVDGNHIVVHPVVHHLVALRSHSLCYLALVMREDKVHSAAVYVEVGTEILASHGGALAVPARESVAPGTWPAHYVLGRSLLPEGKVGLVALLAHTVKSTRCVLNVVEIASREYAVVVILVVLLNVEVDRAVALVGKSVVQYLLYKLLLLDDMARSVRLDAWRQNVECLHCGMVAVGIELCYLHRLELLKASLLLYLVVALVGIVLQVAHVCNVAHIAHLVAEVLEVAEEDVEGNGWTGVSEVRIAIDGRSTDVHAYVRGMQRFEHFLSTRQRIVNPKYLFHNVYIVIILLFYCKFSKYN